MHIKVPENRYFSRHEVALWSVSVIIIIAFFFVFDRQNYLSLIASLIGTSSLILNAKGNPIGQALMVIFSVMLRYYILFIRLLRGNDNISRNDCTYGATGTGFMDKASL